MRDFALVYPQLMNQALAKGWNEPNLARLKRTHDFTLKLFDGFYRAQGVPFICHLTRTASIVLAEGWPPEAVETALLHAAYLWGQFADGRQGGASKSHRAQLKHEVGEEVEALVCTCQKLPWREKDAVKRHVDDLETYSDETRKALAIRLANELEDYLDLAMVYRGTFPYREWLRDCAPSVLELARRLGSPALVLEFQQAFEASLDGCLPSIVQQHCRDAYELPEHVWLRMNPLRKLGSRLKRLILRKDYRA